MQVVIILVLVAVEHLLLGQVQQHQQVVTVAQVQLIQFLVHQ
jgi:hypothetical protein